MHHRSSESSLAAHQQLLQNQHSLQFQPRCAATASGIHASFRYDTSFATASASPPIFAAPPARIGPRLALASQHDWARRQPPLGQPAFAPQQAGASSQACASLPPRPTPPLLRRTSVMHASIPDAPPLHHFISPASMIPPKPFTLIFVIPPSTSSFTFISTTPTMTLSLVGGP